MASSCLVTGGAGFIGSAIVRALLVARRQVRVLDNFFSGKRENLAEVAGRHRADRGRHPRRGGARRAPGGRRGGVPRGGHPVGAALAGRPAREPRGERHRDAEGPARGRSSAGVRRVVYAASSSAYGDTPTLPKVETMRPAPLSPYAVSQAGGRAVLPGLRRRLRPRDGVSPLLQRVRAAAGSEVGVRGGDPALRHRRRWPGGRHHLRRRHAVARLLLHRQHRRGEPGGRARRPRAPRAGCSTSPAGRDHAERGGEPDRRDPRASRSRSPTRRRGWATSSTRWRTSRRRARGSATGARSRSPRGCAGPSTGTPAARLRVLCYRRSRCGAHPRGAGRGGPW